MVERIATLVRSARAAGLRIVYSRHYNVPLPWAGVGQLRMAKTWQRVRTLSELKQHLMYGSPEVQIVDAVAPRPGDLVLDKVTMSAFEGTPLALLLRDFGLSSVLLAGHRAGGWNRAHRPARGGPRLHPRPGSGRVRFGQRRGCAAMPAALRYCDSVLTDLSSVLGALPPGQREPNTG